MISMTNTPGTAGDRTLAVKSRKNVRKINFFSWKNKIYPPEIFFFCIYLLVMPKYWVKNYFAHGSFPEVGQKQKTEKKRKKERENEREKDWTMVITMAKLHMAHASTHGARKPPGPKQPKYPTTIFLTPSHKKEITNYCSRYLPPQFSADDEE